MKDQEKWFYDEKVKGETGLMSEMVYQMRRVHHYLDNYGGSMGEDLKEALEQVETDYKAVLEVIEKKLV